MSLPAVGIVAEFDPVTVQERAQEESAFPERLKSHLQSRERR